jgi:hypothetical protein
MTSSDNLKRIIALRKNPDIFLLQVIQTAEEKAKEEAKKIIEERLLSLNEEIKNIREDIFNELKKEINNNITSILDKDIINTAVQKTLSLVKGEQGEQGIQGEKGDKGDKGNSGDRGESGVNGTNGINGKNGSPDKPEEIKIKLEKLKGEERLDKKAIKGLEELFDELKNNVSRELQNIRNQKISNGGGVGGGGMGNVITETPTGSINGVNATFILSSNVKTNSLILLVNGIFQRSGVSFEYTLSGKTITFNAGSIPTSGEIFAWYVRK